MSTTSRGDKDKDKGLKKKKPPAGPVKKKPAADGIPQTAPVAAISRLRDVPFGDNTYSGVVKQDHLGLRFLDDPAATYTWKDGVKYEGPFVASQIKGQGKFIWPDGSTYTGDVHHGKRHGSGAYLAANGITKYEGQWQNGQRHGRGRLTYDALGETFYDGEWRDGLKHGKGFQVWPSKNRYDGEWQNGRMHGHGRMIWCEGGVHEEYVGNWEDDKPQGVGKHTWHSPAPKSDGRHEILLQQMNNSYEGCWKEGVRHGQGTFNYANGSKYTGSWDENVKEGEGRYIYDDGRVYIGNFSGDQMAEPPAESLNRTVLNIGHEDNPVRRCIHIADLEIFALPSAAADPLSSAASTAQVMREVHNLLLRQLGELRKLYAVWRVPFRKQGGDPFLLSVYQLWALARDLDLISLTFPLSAFNRSITSGLRFLEEASHEDVLEMRPLTPRLPQIPLFKLDETRRSPAESEQKEASQRVPTADLQQTIMTAAEDSNVGEEEGEDEEEEAEGEEEGQSAAPSRNESRASRQSGGLAQRASKLTRQTLNHLAGTTASEFLFSSDKEEPPLYSRFWRKVGEESEGGPLEDIHSASRCLMFRHFLEALVRIAHGRFWSSQGLEIQLSRLVAEKLTASCKTCQGIMKPEKNTDLECTVCKKRTTHFSCEKRDCNYHLCEEHSKVSGQTSPGLTDSIFGFLVDLEIEQVLTVFHSKLWELFTDASTGEGAHGPPLWSPLADQEVNCGSSHPRRTWRRHFGGPHRRVQLQARLDITTRVKDVLLILQGAGLLLPPPEVEDLSGAVLDANQKPEKTPGDSQAPFAGLDFGLLGSHPEDEDAVMESTTSQFVSTNGEAGGKKALAAKTAGAQPQELPVLAVEEILKCDFRICPITALSLLLEVHAPETGSKLRWSLPSDAPPEEEKVTALDFVETELTFVEFQRFLLRMAENRVAEANLPGVLPQARCLEGFLRLVFFPALESPYVAPQSAPLEPPVDAVEAAPEVAPAPAPEQEEPQAEAAEVAVSPEEAAHAMAFWLGVSSDAEVQEALRCAPRVWPEEYAEAVAQW